MTIMNAALNNKNCYDAGKQSILKSGIKTFWLMPSSGTVLKY